MSVDLYDHQIEVLNKLKNGSILVGGVGSGKSRAALAYYYLKVCKGSLQINGNGKFGLMREPKDLYIITTAHKRDMREWNQEAIPFHISEKPEDNPNGVKMIVDSWNNIAKYGSIYNAFFIFDEQRVVGYGKWARTFIKIAKRNKWILLSATPGDQWSDYIPVFIANGFYKNKNEFTSIHCVYSRFTNFPKIEKYINTGRLIRYRENILVDMKYVRPTTTHNLDIICEYDKKLYLQSFKNRWNFYTETPVEDASQLCYLLRKIVNTSEDRVEHLKTLVRNNPKVIIFYNFDYELEILRKVAEELEITKGELNGHMHTPIPKADKWMYLVQYTAGAEAWNCIETNVIIFFSQNYSYKIMVQSSGRIDRNNTPFSDLYYYHLRTNSPIDLAILQALKRKKKFNERKFIGD